MTILVLLIIPISAFILPILIIWFLMKKIGIKEAWTGLIVIIISLFFLSFIEITSMYAPTLKEQIRLYFHNDGQMVFAFIYLPALISSLISTIMLIIFTLIYKKRHGD